MTEPTFATAAAPQAKSASLWEDFIDVLYAPARVFERRRGRGFGGPLFVLALLFGIVAAATMSLTRPLMDRQMDVQFAGMREKGMTEDQISAARGMSEKFAPVSAIGAPSIGLLIVVPIAAAVLWGIGRAFGGAFGYSAAGIVTTYSIVPGLIMAVVGALLLLVLDPASLPLLQQMTVGPVLLLGRDASPVLVALLTRVGVAEIWGFVITVIGLQVLAKLPRNLAIGAAVANWALGTVVAVLFGLRAAAAMGG
ncbi:MAG: YIP1 family protein [Gemmatirosa sp.]